jgi:hypothetical protein
MTPPVDPNDVLMTGENSFIRLSPDGGKTMSDRLSHWRVLWCPAGAGHALFVQSVLTDGQVRVYSDNIAVTRWLQHTIETLLYAPFADPRLPVLDAAFERRCPDDVLVRLRRAVRAHHAARLQQSPDRGLQHVLPGPRGAGRAERPVRERRAVGGDARGSTELERLSGLVRDLGQAEGVEAKCSPWLSRP